MKMTSLSFYCAALTMALASGCASDYTLQTTNPDGSANFQNNYYSFEHPFTDKAEAAVLSKALELCLQRKLVAVKTSRACTLNSCKTNFQCVDAVAAKAYSR